MQEKVSPQGTPRKRRTTSALCKRAKGASTGQILWHVNWQTTVTEQHGRTEVEINEQGAGQPWRYKEPITWKKRMVFLPEPSMVVDSLQGTRWTADGKVLSEVDMRRDPSNGKLTYVDSDAGAKPVSAVFQPKPESLPDELLFYWARTLPFDQSALGEAVNEACTLILSPTRQFKMDAKVKGMEVVTTPAGTFSCWRVDLAPRLVGPLKALAPKMALWCSTDSPHYWVRYQGPVGGPGSPTAIIELVKFEQERG